LSFPTSSVSFTISLPTNIFTSAKWKWVQLLCNSANFTMKICVSFSIISILWLQDNNVFPQCIPNASRPHMCCLIRNLIHLSIWLEVFKQKFCILLKDSSCHGWSVYYWK
jgi:hypothetical protein